MILLSSKLAEMQSSNPALPNMCMCPGCALPIIYSHYTHNLTTYYPILCSQLGMMPAFKPILGPRRLFVGDCQTEPCP